MKKLILALAMLVGGCGGDNDPADRTFAIQGCWHFVSVDPSADVELDFLPHGDLRYLSPPWHIDVRGLWSMSGSDMTLDLVRPGTEVERIELGSVSATKTELRFTLGDQPTDWDRIACR